MNEADPVTALGAATPIQGRGRFRAWLDVVTSILMMSAAIAVLYGHFSSKPGNAAPTPTAVLRGAAPLTLRAGLSEGNADAPIAMIVFSDFECPFCARFARDTLPQLRRQYVLPGILRLEFRHSPLAIHKSAESAALAAECAAQQGVFWKLHDILFADRQRLDSASLEVHMTSVGASTSLCRRDEAAKALASDRADAEALGLKSTPTAVLGIPDDGKIQPRLAIRGAQPLAVFGSALDELLNETRRAAKPGRSR
ncbi:MAG: thioredoxin domain-containing protein [Caldilineaceae bacterium]|nr:thioredoxin domain-containing protein [Caldilineaceae bacterium]